MKKITLRGICLSCLLGLAGSVGGCANATVVSNGQGGSTGSGAGASSGSGAAGGTLVISSVTVTPPPPAIPDGGQGPVPCDNNVCTDFASSPVIDQGAPANAASQFSGSGSGSGPCVVEPEDGSLLPYNWTRPRIKWTGSGLAQITIHADLEANDLVVYTAAGFWVMDAKTWQGLAEHVQEQDISVSVRLVSGGTTTVKFQVASASAAGTVVYWAANPTQVNNQAPTAADAASSLLRGFTVGDDGVTNTLMFSQVQQPTRDQSSSVRQPAYPLCIGCHSATPEGTITDGGTTQSSYMAFVDFWPWDSVIAGVQADNVGAQLPNLSVGGLADLNKPWAGPATFSALAWQPGQRIMVTTSSEQSEQTPWETDDKDPAKLVWYNLDSPAPPTLQTVGANQQPIAQAAAGNYGVIARNGDSNCAAFPTWSHDGTTIIYASSNGGCQDGRLAQGATDLYSVPYNNMQGGDAKPVPGASDKSWEEYYPAYAPDDSMVVFDRIPSGGVMYANPSAEIFFVPLGSAPGAGTAQRLAANDPVACTGLKSPGVNNHFPKWAPVVQGYNGTAYYWIIYSSNRQSYDSNFKCLNSKYDTTPTCHPISQLYLTAITLDKNGKYKTYPSSYLWWQAPSTDKNPMVNTTPVWDMITIPPVTTTTTPIL